MGLDVVFTRTCFCFTFFLLSIDRFSSLVSPFSMMYDKNGRLGLTFEIKMNRKRLAKFQQQRTKNHCHDSTAKDDLNIN